MTSQCALRVFIPLAGILLKSKKCEYDISILVCTYMTETETEAACCAPGWI